MLDFVNARDEPAYISRIPFATQVGPGSELRIATSVTVSQLRGRLGTSQGEGREGRTILRRRSSCLG